jgi:hypothetical protein
MARSVGIGGNESREGQRVQDARNAFERACQGSGGTEFDPFLPAADDPLRQAVLGELIRADMELRWRRRQPAFLETYLERYPELGTPHAVPARLVHDEYVLRHRFGDKPALDLYAVRFPGQFDELRRLVEASPVRAETASVAAGTARVAGPAPTPRDRGGRDVLPVGGGYTLIRRIGAGSYGEVWQAEAPGGVAVALKIIHRPLDHAEAQRELQALELIKGLRHPFLAQTQAYWPLEDRLLIVMELADGNLRDRLKAHQEQGRDGIPPAELLAFFHEAAEALDFLHANQVQHRDVKPDNMLCVGRHIKLADFGLARVQGNRSVMTATSSGTPNYMAPEIWQGRVAPQSDQYSLAATYVELRLGRPLFPVTNFARLMMDHLETAPDLATLPEPERQVLLRALAKDAAQRYTTCRDFVNALELGATAVHTEQAEPAPRKRWAGWLGLVLVAACVVIGASIYFAGDRPKAEVDWLPPGIEKAVDAAVRSAGGKRLYDRVLVVKNGHQVPFRLIEHQAANDPPTFYAMEDKVTNRLFALAAADPEFVDRLAEFDRDYPGTIKREWQRGGVGDGKDLGVKGKEDYPVLRVTVLEAYALARWLGGEWGELPTLEQWKKAGGGLAGARGPLAGDWRPGKVGVNRPVDGPLPVGAAEDDVGRFGCRDMAGNGREWTRKLVNGRTVSDVPHPKPFEELLVYTQGASYRAEKPFEFRDPDPNGDYAEYFWPHPEIGFRVVLEPQLPR